MPAPVTIAWPGGEHEFAFRLGEIRKLQDHCDAGPEYILNRLRLGQWRVDDLIEIHRLGLIGGGMPTAEAGPLVMKVFDMHPPIDFKLTAMSILAGWLFGPPDDQPKKPEEETHPPTTTPEENTDSA